MLQWLFGTKKPADSEKKQKSKKPKRQKAEQESEDNWMYEFLVQFLGSPVWRVSILEYVDNNCIVFDSEEENKFQYTTIHKKFKQLVGTLFDGMMTEVGLSEEKLIELLERGFQSKQKKLFNQLLLCDDFLKFKGMMVKRNKSLEDQAIRALKGDPVRRNSRHDLERDQLLSSQKEDQDRRHNLQKEEEDVLRKVLEMSRLEAEETEAINKLERAAEESQLKQFQEEPKEEQKEPEKEPQKENKAEEVNAQGVGVAVVEKPEDEKKVEREDRKERIRAKLRKEKEKQKQAEESSNIKSSLPPLKTRPQKQQQGWDLPVFKQEKIEAVVEEKKEPVKMVIVEEEPEQEPKKVQPEPPIEKLEDRKKRLLEQREKIRRKKEEERKKMLQDSEIGHKPQTVNVVLQDDGIHESSMGNREPVQEEREEKVSKEEIERRKALMRKIKHRIVDDF